MGQPLGLSQEASVRGRYHSVTIKNVIFDGCHGWNAMEPRGRFRGRYHK